LSWCEGVGIKNITVFVCSTENLRHCDEAEVEFLMRVIEEVVAARLARREDRISHPAARVYAGASDHQKIVMRTTARAAGRAASLPAAVGATSACHLAPGGHMRRGEVWWAEFDERRPVVLLSEEDPSRFRAMQVVAAADTDISGLGIEVAVGVPEGLPFEGVLRFGFPWPGYTPCTWLTTLGRDDLIERAGEVSTAKLGEIDDALCASEQRMEWTPAAAARLSAIRDSLRRRTQADGEANGRPR
jgi:mRNA interferase MazF